MPKSVRPAETARATLAAEVKKVRRSRNNRLPTITVLAAQACVARNTMLRAVREQVRLGAITAVPGGGMRVTLPPWGKAGTTPLPAPPRKKWERIAARIRQDLHNGLYHDESLPPNVTLARRYGVNDRTVRKAVASLINERTLAYVNGRPARPRHRARPYSTLLLLARGDVRQEGNEPTPYLAPISTRTQENLRALEYHCSQIGVKLQAVPCFYYGPGAARAGLGTVQLDRLLRSRAVVGVLVWDMALPVSWVTVTVRRLYEAGLHIALLQESGHEYELAAERFGPRVRTYHMGGSDKVGVIAGEYLLHRGHNRVAYITAWPETPWSQHRWNGLAAAYAGVGLSGAVEMFTATGTEDTVQRDQAIADVRRAYDAALARRMRIDGASPAMLSQPVPLFDEIGSAVSRGLLHRRLQPVFERLAVRTEFTAWACVNDAVGFQALEFLRSRKIAVPEKVAILGFDDLTEASYRDLTSFNFNGTTMVRAMADFAVSRDRRPTAPDIDGFMVERGSTRR